MKNKSKKVVFAQNLIHASAFIKWDNLDPELWHANEYGGNLIEEYDRAILVRPIDGVTNEHFLWIVSFLLPKIKCTEMIIPMHWHYDEFCKLKYVS